MEEFEQIFNLEKSSQLKDQPRHHVLGSGSCSALIKILPDQSDILTSHVTWNSYESMIRILKKYSFEVHETAQKDSPLIPGHSASFSSYPGLLYSGDDFTVLSSGLVAQETTIGNNVNSFDLKQISFTDFSIFVIELQERWAVEVHPTHGTSSGRNPLGGCQQIGHDG